MNNNQKYNITPIKIYTLKNINKSMNNFYFIDKTNLDIVVQELQEKFSTNKTYTGKEISDLIKIYLKNNYLY